MTDKKNILLLSVWTMILMCCYSCRENGIKPISGDNYYVCAYVWPSCHDDSLGHKYLWPQGEGEWEVIKQGNPRFPGHYQPKQPLWGYGHDDDPKVVEKWIDTALKYGVNTFVYDWYWFMDYPYLEGALDDGFLGAKNNEKMNFYIMWANHEVKKNYWNYHLYGDDTSLLFDPKVNMDQFKTIVARVIKQYFNKKNYVKIDGCPVFGIFDMDQFVQSFGTIDEAAKAMEYFRAEVKKAGFKGLHIQQNNGGGSFLAEDFIIAQQERRRGVEDIRKLVHHRDRNLNLTGLVLLEGAKRFAHDVGQLSLAQSLALAQYLDALSDGGIIKSVHT